MPSNPWLKKNPLMSLWLSGANSIANSARGQMTAGVKRQSTALVDKAAQDMLSLWTDAMTGAPAARPRSRKKRK